MPSTITPDQARELWDNPNPAATIDRGDNYAPVTKDDLEALASDLDTDEDGYPLADQWDVLAEQLNSDPLDEPRDTLLDEIADASHRRDRVKAEADASFNEVIRAAVASKRVAVTAIAASAGLSRERIYQIRDARR